MTTRLIPVTTFEYGMLSTDNLTAEQRTRAMQLLGSKNTSQIEARRF
jgi:hypothetical protein